MDSPSPSAARLVPTREDAAADGRPDRVGAARRRSCARIDAPPPPVVTSQLDPAPPVTEAEINLIIDLLGDTIAEILDSQTDPCRPAPSDPAG